jgi:hypothetical protein
MGAGNRRGVCGGTAVGGIVKSRSWREFGAGRHRRDGPRNRARTPVVRSVQTQGCNTPLDDS